MARTVDLMGVGVTPVEVELAEKLVEIVPSFERVVLTSTGSEATFHALRLARAVTGRRLVVKFQGCYHGWHDSVAMNVISRADRVGHKDPLSKGVLPEVTDATLVSAVQRPGGGDAAVDEHQGEIAAIILEPIPHNIGAVLPRRASSRACATSCTREGIVLIFDEVITGFRHAVGGYQSVAGVTPDLTTVGKAMANGYPIGAVGGRADLMDQFSTDAGATRSSSPARSTAIRPAPRRRSRRSRSSRTSPSTSTSSRSASGSGRSWLRCTRASRSRPSCRATARSSSATSSTAP